jgi:hypothetical protein
MGSLDHVVSVTALQGKENKPSIHVYNIGKYVCVYMYIYICIDVYVYIYIYIHTYTYIYIYIVYQLHMAV